MAVDVRNPYANAVKEQALFALYVAKARRDFVRVISVRMSIHCEALVPVTAQEPWGEVHHDTFNLSVLTASEMFAKATPLYVLDA